MSTAAWTVTLVTTALVLFALAVLLWDHGHRTGWNDRNRSLERDLPAPGTPVMPPRIVHRPDARPAKGANAQELAWSLARDGDRLMEGEG